MRWEVHRLLRRSVLVHPAEGAAAAGGAAAGRAALLAALVSSHILRDGELVLMVLRPSFWFIVFNAGGFAVMVAVAALLGNLLTRLGHEHFYFEAAVFVIAGRVMVSTLQWMGKLYVLTDLRVLTLSGVFVIDLFDCPLRKVVRTRLVSPLRERAVGVGSIEIIPRDEAMPASIWQTIPKPVLVHEQLVAAINRSRQSGLGGEG